MSVDLPLQHVGKPFTLGQLAIAALNITSYLISALALASLVYAVEHYTSSLDVGSGRVGCVECGAIALSLMLAYPAIACRAIANQLIHAADVN